MLSEDKLRLLQQKNGLPRELDKRDAATWWLYPRILNRWIAKFPKTTVHTVFGCAQRPLVKSDGLLTDIVTGTQFKPSGTCKSSLQMALKPFKYITRLAKK